MTSIPKWPPSGPRSIPPRGKAIGQRIMARWSVGFFARINFGTRGTQHQRKTLRPHLPPGALGLQRRSRMAGNKTMEHGGSPIDDTRGVVRGAGPRHSILDLAPLELECLSA